jgi:hypothetical protein
VERLKLNILLLLVVAVVAPILAVVVVAQVDIVLLLLANLLEGVHLLNPNLLFVVGITLLQSEQVVLEALALELKALILFFQQ